MPFMALLTDCLNIHACKPKSASDNEHILQCDAHTFNSYNKGCVALQTSVKIQRRQRKGKGIIHMLLSIIKGPSILGDSLGLTNNTSKYALIEQHLLQHGSQGRGQVCLMQHEFETNSSAAWLWEEIYAMMRQYESRAGDNYLQPQLLHHTVNCMLYIMPHRCIVLVPNKPLILDDLQTNTCQTQAGYCMHCMCSQHVSRIDRPKQELLRATSCTKVS